MMPTIRTRKSPAAKLLIAFALLCFLPQIAANYAYDYELHPANIRRRSGSPERPAFRGPPHKRASQAPLIISNNCAETIWPGVGTQAGTGPGTGGFELASGSSNSLMVSGDWQGRVWGRTNCSFAVGGDGPSNLNGVNGGGGAACGTGDCGGVLDCVNTGATPVTLAEFDLAGGVGGNQVFYDISLVDGYNMPLGITFIPGNNTALQDIPPNLTNCACIATAGLMLPPAPSGTLGNSSNSSYPIPYEQTQTSDQIASWCPWDLQVTQPTKPGDGVYPYPDANIQRPIFDPCLSACAKSNSPSDCCTGSYNDPKVCKPNGYSTAAKAICPDAYSFAFDDQTSTFIIPSGGGWEVTFCPTGRSTNILKTFKAQLGALSQAGHATKAIQDDAMNLTLILEGGKENGADRSRGEGFGSASLAALVVFVAWAVLL